MPTSDRSDRSRCPGETARCRAVEAHGPRRASRLHQGGGLELLPAAGAAVGCLESPGRPGRPVLRRPALLPAGLPAGAGLGRASQGPIARRYLGPLLPPDAQRVPGLAINTGILLKAEEAPGAAQAANGPADGPGYFQGVESTLAVEVSRQAVPGADPETQPGPVTADLYAASGRMSWQEEAGQPPIVLERRSAGHGGGADEPEPSQQFPKWVYSDTTTPLDQRGAMVLERELSSGRPASLVLRELVDFKLKEVRSLAVRSLALLGDFDPLLRTLDDPDQKLYWDDSIEQLRAGVMRDPASAAAVRSTMERFYGPQGANLYEMLWKYGPVLSNAEARQLTECLDHQNLAFRILAFWNLKNILRRNYPPLPSGVPAGEATSGRAGVEGSPENAPALRDTAPERGAKAAPRESPAETPPAAPDGRDALTRCGRLSAISRQRSKGPIADRQDSCSRRQETCSQSCNAILVLMLRPGNLPGPLGVPTARR